MVSVETSGVRTAGVSVSISVTGSTSWSESLVEQAARKTAAAVTVSIRLPRPFIFIWSSFSPVIGFGADRTVSFWLHQDADNEERLPPVERDATAKL